MRSPVRLAALVGLVAGGAAAWLTLAPPQVWLDWRKRVDPTPEVGARLVERYGCRRCHRIAGAGAVLAPDLSGITRRVDDPARVALRLWLRDPQAVQADTNMPDFHLSSSEISAILAYLESVDREAIGEIGREPRGPGDDGP